MTCPIRTSRIVHVGQLGLAACPSCGAPFDQNLVGHSGPGPFEVLGVSIEPEPNWWKGTCQRCRSVVERHLLGFEGGLYVVAEETEETFLGLAARERLAEEAEAHV